MINRRRILVLFLLLAGGLAVMILAGKMGLGEKVGAPGLDKLVPGLLERLGSDEGRGPTTLPWNIKEIAGSWSGVSDVDGTVWRFTFENNFAVRASSSSGYYYDGTAFVHWEMGLTDGHVRVPPGWNALDVDTISSSEPSHRNKASLGAYSLQRGLLKYCFSEPGKMIRPVTDMSRDGIRCFELARVTADSGGPVGGRARPSVQEVAPLSAEDHTSRTDLTAAVPLKSIDGQAEILIDGSKETWPLRNDRNSATDITDPHRLTLQFQDHGAMFPVARRIELTIDAARTGRHRADGAVYLDNLFIRERVPVGSDSSGAPEAVFLYIAEGGRIFPPQLSCEIRVTKSFEGDGNILLEGRVADCVVSSAGEHHAVQSFSFRAKGKLR